MSKFIKTKNLIWLLGFSAVLLLPSFASAATVEELQAQIDALMAQIKQLQAQIVTQQGTTTAWCHTFNVNLRIESEGEEVGNLHIALKKEGFDVPETQAAPGQYFSEQTAAAVSGFQEKYRGEILTPLGLKYGTGFVGAATRAKLNKLYGCGVTPPPTTPSITVLSPNGGESWQIGSSHQISWNVSGFSNPLIAITLNKGSNPVSNSNGTLYYIAKNISITSPFSWTIPSFISPGTDYTMTIQAYDSATGKFVFDFSDAQFSIVATNTSSTITFSRTPQTSLSSLFKAGDSTTGVWQFTPWSFFQGEDWTFKSRTTDKVTGITTNDADFSASWSDIVAQKLCDTNGNCSLTANWEANQFTCATNVNNIRKREDWTVANGIESNHSVFYFKCSNTTSSITSISPLTGPLGTDVVITGSGFTATNNTIYMGTHTLSPRLSQNNGTQLGFTIPNTWNDGTAVAPGYYVVYVSNANGTSNTNYGFTVTAAAATLPLPTSLSGFTSHLYTCVLERAAGQSEIDYWNNLLTSKTYTPEQEYGFFFDSPEYNLKNTSNDKYVNQLYRCILFRNPSQTEIDYWSKLLAGKTRVQEANDFLTSVEFVSAIKPKLDALYPATSSALNSMASILESIRASLGNLAKVIRQ